MATRFCLSHAWPGPRCLLLSPPGNRKGMWRPGSLQPCQESPGGPAGVLGEAQDGPSLSPQALPDPARHRGAAHRRRWPWNHPQLLELTAPTAGPAPGRLWGTAGRAALAAGDGHSALECSPGTALPCRARGHCQPCSPCGSTGSPLLLLGAPTSSPVSVSHLGQSQHCRNSSG